MGSKKHKKDSKKKKHRSRSRSPLETEERERRKHKKHKDRKRTHSPEVEEVPVDSHLISHDRNGGSDGARSESVELDREREREREKEREKERDRRMREEAYRERERERERERQVPKEKSPVAPSNAHHESLSIEDTNRLRAKLGLKPLEVAERPAQDDGKLKDDLGEFYHRPAANLSQQKKTDKIREKINERKERRTIEQKLQTALLGDASDDDDPMAWVKKSREIEKQKKEAEKRAKMLDEMDEVFGVSALVAEEEKETSNRSYTANNLKGLRVAHDFNALGEERDVILTLADKDVLAEDNEDVLVNVNIVDEERHKKNILERRKAAVGYQAYEDAADVEAAALGLHKSVLSKYDDEIDKTKEFKERGFTIGDDDGLEAKRFKEMMMAERLATGGPGKRLESLKLPPLQIAQDYMDDHEVQATFKKFKKRKGKIRKRAKAEPIDVDEYDPNLAPLETDDTEVKSEALSGGLAVDEEEVEVDSELQGALARARRLRQTQGNSVPKMEEILSQVRAVKEEEEEEEGGVVLESVAEFCRTLGDIPTYGQAGNRDHHAEILDFERDDGDMDIVEEENPSGAWSRVDIDTEKPPDITAGPAGGLEAEPDLGGGVAGALLLASSKGYLERTLASTAAVATRNQLAHLLTARHYSIEDKAHGEDDKHGRRERGYAGPVHEFREKSNFKPNIKLEYVDDDGRPLCPKEAFRYLSHKFHGKGPGKNKQEKRLKKAVQEGLMKKMSSTDTPLNTLSLLQEKQKETQSPFIVLSGLKKEPNK